MHLCSRFCVQKLSGPNCFCARDFSLTVKAFWCAERLREVKKNLEEMRKVGQCSDERKTVEKIYLDDM